MSKIIPLGSALSQKEPLNINGLRVPPEGIPNHGLGLAEVLHVLRETTSAAVSRVRHAARHLRRLDSSLPYLEYWRGNGSESCWTPGYRWGGSAARWLQKRSDHWSYEYAPGIDKGQLPHYTGGAALDEAGLRVREGSPRRARIKEISTACKLCPTTRLRQEHEHERRDPPKRQQVDLGKRAAQKLQHHHRGGPSMTSILSRPSLERDAGLTRGRCSCITDWELWLRGSGVGGHHRPAPYDHRDLELSSPPSTMPWKNALKRREQWLWAECWDSADEDRQPLVGNPVQRPGKKAGEATRCSGDGLGEQGGGSA
ncbi:hypothetical protein DL764_010460 [Monosporascus ibericus]|uniref:Uncharacterized protein n=1 Tax=Monosporascus ibericus TaxID=155417 RepID=A0A4Q4SVC0_9PEZI|nr:hypothetical protein DL764_010460 [Monosporascus ibericus]